MGQGDAISAAAVRIDPTTRVREEALFLSDSSDPVLIMLHLPDSDPRGAVVVCSPIGAEFDKNYRREVLLGRALAARGIAAVRFHYRGTGNSGGDPGATTFETMADDAFLAADELATRTGIKRMGAVGTRLGAMVASRLAHEMGRAPLALWEPATDAAGYFRELSRSRMIRRMTLGKAIAEGPSMMTELESTGHSEVVGYSIHSALVESMAGVSLGDQAVSPGQRIMLVQISESDGLSADLVALQEHWENRGASLATHHVHGEEVWWFVSEQFEQEERRDITTDVVDVTVRWFDESADPEAVL